MRHALLSLVLLLPGLFCSSLCQAEGYEFGQGWHAGNYYFSGYANAEIVDRFDAPTRLDIDDLSLFAGGRINQWVNPFMEAELSKHTLIRQGGNPVRGDIIVERFYNESIVTEQDTVRLGKLLTPMGDWNLVHAAPLIPIITRPYTTSRGFAAYITGVNWQHDPENGATPDVQIYWQPDTEMFKRPISQTVRNFSRVYGGHINIPFGLLDKIGASFQHGQLVETGETYTLYGVNANKSFGKLRLESEAITARFSGAIQPHDHEMGIFGLADYSCTPQWHGILESEYYQDHQQSLSPSRSTMIAAAYKPNPAMVWKLEYIHQAGVSALFAPIHTGLKASYSLLF